MTLLKSQARKVARSNAADAAKIIIVQERQIKHQNQHILDLENELEQTKTQLLISDSLILALSACRISVDAVNPSTGEVKRKIIHGKRKR